MKRSSLAAILATVVVSGFLAASAFAVDSPKMRVSTNSARTSVKNLVMDKVDTRQGITKFFQAFHKQFAIDPDVKGTFSVRLKNRTFDSALISILAAASVGYENRDGVYVVSRNKPDEIVKVPPIVQPAQPSTVTIDLDDTNVREGLQAIFQMSRVRFRIAPEVKGNVTVNLRRVSLDDALRIICDSVGATWRVDQGTYLVTKKG